MRRMFSKKQLENLSENVADARIEESIDDGAIKTELDKKLDKTGGSITGNLAVSGNVSGDAITGNSIIENMSGYSLTKQSTAGVSKDWIYAGIVKNGNKLTFVGAIQIEREETVSQDYCGLCKFTNLPEDVASKIYPSTIAGLTNGLNIIQVSAYRNFASTPANVRIAFSKTAQGDIDVQILSGLQAMTNGYSWYLRFELTLLLSENLASE